MASELSCRKELQQSGQKLFQLLKLLRGKRVGRMSFRVQSTFVAYANGAPVEGAAMGPHFEQSTVLADSTVAADIEVIADGAEPAGTMVAQELLHGVVAVATGSGAVQDDVTHRVGGVHHQSALHPGEEFTLIEHLLPAHSHRECLLYHSTIYSIAVEQLVTPSAVSAAMAA